MLETSFRTIRDDPVAEGTTAVFTARLTDADGEPILGTAVLTLDLTLLTRDADPPVVVNGRDRTNILNANGGTVALDGLLTLTFLPADLVILDADRPREGRIARFRWTWTGGQGEAVHDYWFDVENLTP